MPKVAIPATWSANEEGKHVLVLWNRPNPEGEYLANYYAWKRGVPKENVMRVIMDAGEETNINAFNQGIVTQVRDKAKASKTPIDYIVLAKGMPIRIFDASNTGYSLDGFIATMDMQIDPIKEPKREQVTRALNPYYGKNEPFSKAKFGFYLVTRLDGYSYDDARRLVDNSVAAKPDKGPYFIDSVPVVNNDGYGQMNASMVEAGEVLKKKGIDVTVDRTPDFILPPTPLMGYCSWGSNDQRFNASNYLGVRFKPGALAETFVSTSARSLKPVIGGQSVITDLIKNGVTGVKGYVSEPYTLALARPHILFDRYTSGYNLAESFYMASPVLKWRDIVFGDPLCRPYKK
jgi:uncharacterized protein (TIGR03790 family)